MSDEPTKPPTGEHRTVSGEFRAVREESRRNFDWLSVQNIVVLLGIVGTILGGARWLVVATWAQGKEHVDAGLAVQGARYDVLKGDLDAVKARQESQDAGNAATMRRLEEKIDKASERADRKAEETQKMLNEVLREVRRK